MKSLFLVFLSFIAVSDCLAQGFFSSRDTAKSEICRDARFEYLEGKGASEYVTICYMNPGTRRAAYDILANGRHPFQVSRSEAGDFKVYMTDTYLVTCKEVGEANESSGGENGELNRASGVVARCVVSPTNGNAAPVKLDFDKNAPGCRYKIGCGGAGLVRAVQRGGVNPEYEPVRTGSQFSGVQRIETKARGAIRIRVFVDRKRVRVEFGEGGTPVQVILYNLDQDLAYFLDTRMLTATRTPVSSPVLMLSEGYLWTALIYQMNLGTRPIVREKLGEQLVNGRVTDKYRVSGFPGIDAYVYVDTSAKVPVQSELLLKDGASGNFEVVASSTWENVTMGPQADALFAVPSGYKINEIARDFR